MWHAHPPPPQAQFDEAVAVLEADGGVAAPTASPLLDGRWRLLYTSRPGTASPIQRTFTAVDGFKSARHGWHGWQAAGAERPWQRARAPML